MCFVDCLRVQFILIFLSSIILFQWIIKINAVVSSQFKIYLYYDNHRINRETAVSNMKIIDVLFTKKHFIFDEQKQNVQIIIIFIYFTFIEYNELKTQKTWRRNKQHFSIKMIDKMKKDFNVMWKNNLFCCFRIVTCDECHILKNIKIKSSIAI